MRRWQREQTRHSATERVLEGREVSMGTAELVQDPIVSIKCSCGYGIRIEGDLMVPCSCGRLYTVEVRVTGHEKPELLFSKGTSEPMWASPVVHSPGFPEPVLRAPQEQQP